MNWKFNFNWELSNSKLFGGDRLLYFFTEICELADELKRYEVPTTSLTNSYSYSEYHRYIVPTTSKIDRSGRCVAPL